MHTMTRMCVFICLKTLHCSRLITKPSKAVLHGLTGAVWKTVSRESAYLYLVFNVIPYAKDHNPQNSLVKQIRGEKIMNVIAVLDKYLVLYQYRKYFFVLFKNYTFLLNNNQVLEMAKLLYLKSRHCFPSILT